MRDIQFVKMQGTGNDFVLIDMAGAIDQLSLHDLSEFARRVCDRHFGVGADGLILVLKSEKADYKMRIINSDGSEAEMCGNGIRCFARYIWESTGDKKEAISVETIAGVIVPTIILDDNKFVGVEVDMGIPNEESLNEMLTIDGRNYKINRISMGNPHCVIFVNDLEEINLSEIGPVIENLPQFPDRTNVEFAKVINKGEILLKVWERGAGATLACGTGACAAVAAAVLNDLTDRKVIVHLPGGDLEIEWPAESRLLMRGPAEKVFEGKIKV
jgi:diaminopimelate epimerase